MHFHVFCGAIEEMSEAICWSWKAGPNFQEVSFCNLEIGRYVTCLNRTFDIEYANGRFPAHSTISSLI